MSILATTDFTTGDFKVRQNTLNATDMAAFFVDKEREYLSDLLGSSLYALFIADLTAGDAQRPQAARFLAIFNAFTANYETPATVSKGMLYLLKGLVGADYLTDGEAYSTGTGIVKSKNENSQIPPNLAGQRITTMRYKAGLTWKAIQRYIQENLATYPEYDGVDIEDDSPIFW